jgi:hypothetical protein
VQTRDGRSFYTHRSFVKLTKEGHILLSAGELLNKPAGEEYYFTLQEIGDIRDKIPGLYMTPSGRRLVAPWKTPQFLHQGEWAWPVYECLKADCPGRDPTALHGALFILPDPKLTGDVDFRVLEAQRDHQVNTTPGRSAEDEFATAEYVCSHCRQAGRPGSEEAARQQFRRYRLPESETMWRELDDEYQRSRQVRVRKFNRGNPSLAESP